MSITSRRATAAPKLPTAGRMRDLNPGWFASAMGTGILAVTTYTNPGGWAPLASAARGLGVALALVAYALGVLLLVAYAIRWVAHTEAALADFRHPVRARCATLPGGLLAVMTSVVSPSLLSPSTATWVIGAVAAVGGILAFVMAVAFTLTLVTGERSASVNGGWFIPGGHHHHAHGDCAPDQPCRPGCCRALTALGFALFGMGFLLFLLTLGLLYDRLILHPCIRRPWLPPSGSDWARSGWRACPALAGRVPAVGRRVHCREPAHPPVTPRCGASACGSSPLRQPYSCVTSARAASRSIWAGGLRLPPRRLHRRHPPSPAPGTHRPRGLCRRPLRGSAGCLGDRDGPPSSASARADLGKLGAAQPGC